MARVLAAAALVLSLVASAPVARAQTAPAATVFTTVDSFAYDAQDCYIRITGIVQGDAAASEKTISRYCGSSMTGTDELLLRVQACERMALVAMAKPGQYLFQIAQGPTYGSWFGCKLTRVNP